MPRIVYAVYAAPCMLPYYGSTTQTLSNRRSSHKSDYKRWKRGTQTYKNSIFELFDIVGVDSCIFEVVEELADDCTKEQLRQREMWWFNTNACVNKISPAVAKFVQRTKTPEEEEEHLQGVEKYREVRRKQSEWCYRRYEARKIGMEAAFYTYELVKVELIEKHKQFN